MKVFKLLLLLSFLSPSHSFEWPQATPEDVGLSSTALNTTNGLIISGDYGAIESFIVIKDGYLVHERYFGNTGGIHPVFSVTKSVGSTLLGIAQYQGYGLDLQSPVLDYIPQYNNVPNAQPKQAIKVHDLLTQRHGLIWDEWTLSFTHPNNPVYQMMGQNDWYLFVISWPQFTTPDSNFEYSSGASSLMSVMLKHLTNDNPQTFAQENLFNQLSITNYQWNVFNPRRPNQGITNFPHDLAPLGFGLWLKPIDMAKLGQLYLNEGVWSGQRLLDSEWIELSTQSYSDSESDPDVFTSAGSGYGYQWWNHQFIDRTGTSHRSYYADGFGRQYIFVFPEHNSIVVSTADPNHPQTGPGMGTILREHILPSFPLVNVPVAITHDLNGSWYDPEQSGQGINFEILNDNTTLWGYWYTYEASGGAQRWFTLQGAVDGDTADFSIYATEGGVFVDPQAPKVTVWGSGQMQFTGCMQGDFEFTSEDGTISGSIPLTRLTTAGNCNQASTKKSKAKPMVP